MLYQLSYPPNRAQRILRRAGGRQRWLLLLALAACAAPQSEALVATSTGHVFVRTGGQGPDLVLLHGLGDTSDGWRKIEPDLIEAGFRVTVWDALGAGLSDGWKGADLSLPAHVARLAEVLDRQGIERATLVGNSLGGTVALLFAVEHPARVERLVLLAPGTPRDIPTAGWLELGYDLAKMAAALLPEERVARFALGRNFGDESRIQDEDVAVYARVAARYGAYAALADQADQIVPPPPVLAEWSRRIAGLQVPVLLLWGTRDKILDPAHGRLFAAELPHCRFVLLEGLGHAPQLEDPRRVLAELLTFVER